jgi:NADPH-dependent glutamate synthase beta subunit-like oxidoreductase
MSRPEYQREVDAETIIPVSRADTRVFTTGQWSPRKPVHAPKLSPCRESCPVGNNIPEALYHASHGRFDDALALLLQENPLPGTCGRVCYHPCQTKCNRGQFDEAVEIPGLERVIEASGNASPRTLADGADVKITVAVIGSGPAGLSMAYFLALFGHKVTIFESRPEPGGVLRYGIPEYRLPKDVLNREIARILTLGIDLRCGETIDGSRLGGLQGQFDYIFCATGAWLPQEIAIGAEAPDGVSYGLNFLSDANRQELCRGKTHIVVIGGGDVAVDVARTARRLSGPGTAISMVAPEKAGEFPAIPESLTEAEEEGIAIMGQYRPVEFIGRGRLEKVRLADTKVDKDELTGRYVLSQGDGADRIVDADLVIVAIGQHPDTAPFLPELIDKNFSGITVNNLGMTPSPRYYAGGDLTRQRPAVVDAILSGKRAALSIHLKANGYDAETIVPSLALGAGPSLSISGYVDAGRIDLKRVVQFAELNTLLYRKAQAGRAARSPAGVRQTDFREVNRGLTQGAAIDEAKRCFYCGSCVECDLCFLLCPDISIIREGERRYSVNKDYCKGCNICATVCPRHVIEMEDGR